MNIDIRSSHLHSSARTDGGCGVTRRDMLRLGTLTGASVVAPLLAAGEALAQAPRVADQPVHFGHVPPFTRETAIQKVRLAEDGWNSRDAAKVATAYTLDTKWRNRAEFANNRAEAQAFLERKWNKELDYRLIKELWAFDGNRIAVRYAYEWRDDAGNWYRSYGNENWEFEADGLMRRRYACINDMPIKESDRKFHWPLGRRPDDHPSLSELGL